MSNKYILNSEGNPVSENDLLTWASWLENAVRSVANDTIGEVVVSTVFLGIDHNFSNDGPPVLWETMVFGGELDQEQERCSGNREQAEAMHNQMKERVIAAQKSTSVS